MSRISLESRGISYAVPARTILKELSFRIPEGTFTVVVGENGAGKTTLLQIMMGIMEPTSGSLHVLGNEPYRDPYRDRSEIGYVAEKITPPTDWTVEEYLRFNREFYASYSNEVEAQLLREFRLRLDWKVGTLSAGQIRRVQVVGVLACSPKLLIVDEITAVLDIVGRAKFMAALERLRAQRGSTIVMATNILDDVDSYADEVLLLHDGALMAHDTKDALIRLRGAATLTDALAGMIDEAEEVTA